MVRLDPQTLAARLQRLELQHLRRCRRIAEPLDASPVHVRVEGRELINFCSNDYLGLSRHPALIEAAARSLRAEGVGAGASHLVSGHRPEHHALEQELAAFTGRERALLFSSGYLANVGVLSALAGRHEAVIADRLCHASLLDGARLSGADLQRYAHADAGAAAALLQQAPGGALLVTDGVFSMDGDVAPLPSLAASAREQGATLVVDDAHGLGVLGPEGRGSVAVWGLDSEAVPVLIGTLGKAFGTFGAFVAGDADLIELLLQHTRTYLYTTALPPSVAAATRAALRVAAGESWRRERLADLVQRWRQLAAAAGLPLSASTTPIQPLLVGAAARAVRLSEQLAEAGFWVSAIRAPTVPAGSARLRITLCAEHRDEHLAALAERLGALWTAHSAGSP